MTDSTRERLDTLIGSVLLTFLLWVFFEWGPIGGWAKWELWQRWALWVDGG